MCSASARPDPVCHPQLHTQPMHHSLPPASLDRPLCPHSLSSWERCKHAHPYPSLRRTHCTPLCLPLLRCSSSPPPPRSDIKPANIFLCANDLLKIGDLGIAKALTSMNFARTQIGTPCYMAPEVRPRGGGGDTGLTR